MTPPAVPLPNELTTSGSSSRKRVPVALRSVDRKIDITKFLPPREGKEKTNGSMRRSKLLSNQPRDSPMKATWTNMGGDGTAEPRSVDEEKKRRGKREFLTLQFRAIAKTFATKSRYV